MYKPAKLLHNS